MLRLWLRETCARLREASGCARVLREAYSRVLGVRWSGCEALCRVHSPVGRRGVRALLRHENWRRARVRGSIELRAAGTRVSWLLLIYYVVIIWNR